MRKTETFKMEGYENPILVKEISIKQILELFDQKKKISFESLLSDQILPTVCNLTIEEIIEMTPREINDIWEHFKKINKSFFVLGQFPAIKIVLEKLQKSITADFVKMYADSLKLAIVE